MGLLLLVVAVSTRSMRSSLLLVFTALILPPLVLTSSSSCADAFVVRAETSSSRPQIRESPTAQYSNFFKDVFGSAFANDLSLSQDDKLEGMLDEAAMGDEDEAGRLRVQQLTSTQQQWRQKMMSLTSGAVATTDLEGSLYSIDLFLTGVPNKDPSNDLFGSQTNISSRDRVVGLTLPREPSVTDVQLLLEPNGVCRVVKDASGFCLTLSTSAAASSASAAAKGDWKLSHDGRQIRFRVPVTGYKRTIETKGTIQKVYWSKDEEKSTQTSTVYTIPEGYLYFETAISSKRQQPSQSRAGSNSVAALVQWSDDDAVLKVERSMGLLGAASRMIPCGKFQAKLVRSSNSSDNADDDKNSNANQQQPQESSS